jgi:hypothetical protein
MQTGTHIDRALCGHTKVNANDVNPGAILVANTFIVSDPLFTLLCTDQTLSLAIVCSTD